MSTYLQYLIWMMLFVIVIEMIFPDMAYRKYIKLVLGCILVYTMLQPIIRFANIDRLDYENYVMQYQERLGIVQNGKDTYETQVERQQESLEDFYEVAIKQCIEEQVEVSVLQIHLSIEENEIERVDLVVGDSIESIQIGTIHIGDKSNTTSGNEEILKNKIKTCLHDFYNVQVSNIYITVQKS